MPDNKPAAVPETASAIIEHPPHVHRLLRLIREGTSSHASRASVLLGRYAANPTAADHDHDDSAPSTIPSLLIWDLIGRLVGGDEATNNDSRRKKNTQSGLFDSNWSTRYNCAMALESVAKCLPVDDRRHFFEGDVWGDDDNNNSNLWLSVSDLAARVHHEPPTEELMKSTTSINDDNTQTSNGDHSEQSKSQLDLVVEKGRLLLSSSGEQYNWNCDYEANEYIRENEALQNLDATAADDNDVTAAVTKIPDGKEEQMQSFLRRRVALQRQILSRRLGLGGILSAPIMSGDNVDDEDTSSQQSQKPSKRRRIVDDIVADEDLVVQDVVSSSAVTGKNDIDRQDQTTSADSDKKTSRNNSPTAIRALLVLESKRSENYQLEKGGKTARHRNPQTLLGSELAFRTFDSEWTVRHGALLGTLALLRAWRIHNSSTSSQSQQHFGKWPQDILARCVCILSLDQFSDFSDSNLSTTDNNATEDIVSNAVVAPVREMAAQIIAILLEVCPIEVWTCTHDLLMQLYTRKYNHQNEQERGSQWEISHGVLLAWKYIIAITLFQSNTKQTRDIKPPAIPRPLSFRLSPSGSSDISARYHKVLNDIILHAVKGISDGNDDNSAVSAQILRYCMQVDPQLHSIAIVTKCSSSLWTAVTKIGNISACAADLLSLLAEVLSDDCASFLLSLREKHSSFAFDSVLHKLSEFINHDSAHVSISALRALSLVVGPILKDAHGNQETYNINTTVCELLSRVFETYFTNTWTHDVKDEIGRVRDLAWKKIVDALSPLVTQDSTGHLLSSTCFVALTVQYFRISNSAARADCVPTNTVLQEDISFGSHQKAAHALALYFEKLCSPGQSSIACVIEAMLQSPWVDQCEAACLLQVAISSNKFCDSDNCNVPSSSQHNLLTRYLTTVPISILLKEHPEASLLLEECNCRAYCEDQFSAALSKMMQQHERKMSDFSCADVVQDWEAYFAERGFLFKELSELPKAPMSQTSMRLSSSIAGALTCCGRNYLPSKFTPLIRSLFTSLKNEQSFVRRRLTCRYIAELVILLSEDDSHAKTRNKLLENVCNLMCEETQSSQGAMLAIEFLIEHIDRMKKKLQDFDPIWERLSPLRDLSRYRATAPERSLADSLLLLRVSSGAMTANSSSFADILGFTLESAITVACFNSSQTMKKRALISINNFCRANFHDTMDLLIPFLLPTMSDLQDDVGRKGGCELLLSILQEFGVSASQYVPQLLPAAMRLMTDTIRECSQLAASIFAILVRIAPLAACHISKNGNEEEDRVSNRVINHLILGKPMPDITLPDIVSSQLKESGTVLRGYQIEGISWLKFLCDAKLNGALCDDMGLGKTLQALVAVAISHSGIQTNNSKKSLVVCPASVVGHWVREIKRFFPGGTVLAPFAYTGAAKTRRASWSDGLAKCNVVVTSYSVLRTDVDLLESILFDYCILDEGHLLKNPKTATAKASRRLKAHHRLILTGTPVQGNVNEVWATFDFLMPNFLGTETSFSKEFAKPIIKSQAPDATANDIDLGLDCLKILHQQVLPFILRREKMQVMNDLPPKTITDVPCQLSKEQLAIYQDILKMSGTKDALQIVENELLRRVDSSTNRTMTQKIGSDVLKSLLQLRLICTHPLLHNTFAPAHESSPRKPDLSHSYTRIDSSGKLIALNDLLRQSRLVEAEMAAADNDNTGFLLPEEDSCEDLNMSDAPMAMCTASKCLIFAQFTQSLDVVERYLFEPHMPSLQYLRLDGSVPTNDRQSIVDRFNNNENIKVLLLTTKVGGLGLNLTGADKVIFLEPDWNPFVDIQAQDRAHRIGQSKAVNIYRLITTNTIEEKMMELQQRKKAISNAVVNSDNSTMYSMGTEKLLDIFTFRGSTPKSDSKDDDNLLSYLDEERNEYANLSVDAFLGGLS